MPRYLLSVKSQNPLLSAFAFHVLTSIEAIYLLTIMRDLTSEDVSVLYDLEQLIMSKYITIHLTLLQDIHARNTEEQK